VGFFNTKFIMKPKSYKGITFPDDYNKSLKEFKEEFENTHVFNNIPEKEREAELKKAHKIATANGNTIPAATESEKAKPQQGI